MTRFYQTAMAGIIILLAICLLTPGPADAAKKEIRFVSVGWTGVTVKTELGVKILESLGYKASNIMVSVPIVYKALSINEADIFLGNWMPSMKYPAQKYFDEGTVIQYVVNMPGAKYTLAVPTFVAQAGLKHFNDIAKYGDKLDYKIYGIEEGNDGNKIIEDMISKDMFGLGKFELIPSSEPAMLSQVRSFIKRDKWIVFLGWSPHHMNNVIDMTYLQGSTEETFGPDDGTATIYSNIRKGFDKEEPNIAKLLQNLKFPVSMMNEIMTMMHEDKHLKPLDAGISWLKAHPETYRKWMEGVQTIDGKEGLPAFEKYLTTK